MHFDQRDTSRAVTYLQQAAANALRRWAYAEAIGHLRRGLALLPTLPDTRERRQQELASPPHPGAGVHRHPGSGSNRCGRDLYPGAGPLSAGWGYAAAP